MLRQTKICCVTCFATPLDADIVGNLLLKSLFGGVVLLAFPISKEGKSGLPSAQKRLQVKIVGFFSLSPRATANKLPQVLYHICFHSEHFGNAQATTRNHSDGDIPEIFFRFRLPCPTKTPKSRIF